MFSKFRYLFFKTLRIKFVVSGPLLLRVSGLASRKNVLCDVTARCHGAYAPEEKCSFSGFCNCEHDLLRWSTGLDSRLSFGLRWQHFMRQNCRCAESYQSIERWLCLFRMQLALQSQQEACSQPVSGGE